MKDYQVYLLDLQNNQTGFEANQKHPVQTNGGRISTIQGGP